MRTKEKKNKFNKVILKLVLLECCILQVLTLVRYTTNLKMQNVILTEALLRDNKVNIQLNSNIVVEDVKEDETKPSMILQEEDRELLAKLLYCEGRGESYECQKAIVSVVLNRVASNQFPNSIKGVVYQTNQFEPVLRGLLDNAKPSKQQYDAIDEVVNYGINIPEWVCYFRADYHSIGIIILNIVTYQTPILVGLKKYKIFMK